VTHADTDLRAPFPWFGGKSRVAPEVWQRFGDVRNYVEPFFGSGAMLLQRPLPFSGVETVNDKDGFLSNFWRALQADPDAVAKHADKMVNEIDLAAWRDWLYSDMSFQDRMWRDPKFYDVEKAGVWVWGVCSTIGNAWQPKSTHLGAGRGIHRASTHLGAGMGIHRASTHLGDAGRGIHRASTHLGDAGRGAGIREYFRGLALRLERVRVMSGDWSRVTSPTVTSKFGLTGVFLDPPYLDNCTATYNHNDDVRLAVREWVIERGADPKMRIALCGYEGEHDMPDDWSVYEWKTQGGYGSQSDKAGRANQSRERIWFSPHCLNAETPNQMEIAG